MRIATSLMGVACVALSLAGCPSESSQDRRPMLGKVSVAGVPLSKGAIRFVPAPGNSGPAANGIVSNGEYRFTEETGPYAGLHRVIIERDTLPNSGEGSQPAPRDVKSITTGRGNSAPRAREVSKEKSEWEVSVEVPDQGPYEKDFDLAP